jgi:hypothetical protein
MRTEAGDELRACPTCGGEVSEQQLGLRDYSRWLAGVLPGRVSGSDLDCVVEQSATGRMLVLEFKPRGMRLPVGQRLLLRALRQRNITVWVCWEDLQDGHVEVGELDETGEVRFIERMTARQLARQVKAWWADGLE